MSHSKHGEIHHFEINVSNLKISKDFYTYLLAKFNYVLYQEWKLGFSMKLNNTYIVFVQVEADFANNPYHRKNIGLNHLALIASSKEFIDDLRLELITKEITLLYDELYPHAGGTNTYALYFEDPDRLKIEIAYKDN